MQPLVACDVIEETRFVCQNRGEAFFTEADSGVIFDQKPILLSSRRRTDALLS